MRTIIVEPYDPAWPAEFERIKEYLMPYIQDLILCIEHVGSTSVPGLAAKPIIDFDIVIESYAVFPRLLEKLAELGYEHEGDGDIPMRERFKRNHADGFMTYHMYVCPKDSPELRRHILFRDYLRAHDNSRDEYSALKRSLAERYRHDIDSYINGKHEFVEDIIKKAMNKVNKMPDEKTVLNMLNANYSITFDWIELLRDSGGLTYAVYSSEDRYFLKITKPAFDDTVLKSIDIHVFLQNRGFAVPRIIYANGDQPFITAVNGEGDCRYILYEFLEGEEVDPDKDAEIIGALLGSFHSLMKEYTGPLTQRDRQFYIGRYIDIMRRKNYPRINAFEKYGNRLWNRLKDLPRSYSHGDMYSGNIQKTADGKLYILDFDTSCEGFRLYDAALICNRTDFFDLSNDGLYRSKDVFERFVPAYRGYNELTAEEAASFYDMIALYHLALQATIIEIYGIDCVDNEFIDRQLDWLYKWCAMCGAEIKGYEI